MCSGTTQATGRGPAPERQTVARPTGGAGEMTAGFHQTGLGTVVPHAHEEGQPPKAPLLRISPARRMLYRH